MFVLKDLSTSDIGVAAASRTTFRCTLHKSGHKKETVNVEVFNVGRKGAGELLIDVAFDYSGKPVKNGDFKTVISHRGEFVFSHEERIAREFKPHKR